MKLRALFAGRAAADLIHRDGNRIITCAPCGAVPALAARRDVHGLALLLSCGLLLCSLSSSGGSGLFSGFLLGLLLGGLLSSSLFGGFLLGLLLGSLLGGSLFSGFLLSLFLCCLLLGDCLLLCGVIGWGICGFTADREKYEEGGDNILPAAAFGLPVRSASCQRLLCISTQPRAVAARPPTTVTMVSVRPMPISATARMRSITMVALDTGFCGFWGGGTMGGRFAGSTPSVSGRSSKPPVWAFFVPPIFSVFW